MEAAKRGDLKTAEAELRQAIELAPHNPLYLGALGAVLGTEQKLAESNAYLERALAIIPNDIATRRNLASNQFQLGLLQPAKKNLERILEAEPDDAPSVLLLGMVEEELKDYLQAAKLLGSVPDLVRQRPESLAALARSYYYTAQKQKARAKLGELQRHTAGPEGVYLAGQVAAQANDFEMAEQLFASIRSTYSDTKKLGYNLALAQYHANQLEASQATLGKLIDSGHESSEIYNLLSWCFYKRGDFDQALATMDRAVALDPSKESNYLDVGMMLMSHHHFSGARAAGEKAVEVAPASYRAYRLKGLAESELAEYINAEKSFTRALELKPNDAEAIRNLATAQWDLGKLQEAESTFEKGVHQFPRDAKFCRDYGVMLLDTKGGDAAEESRAVFLLRRAIELDGSLSEPHYQLGKLALHKGNAQEAVRDLEAAAKLDPSDSKIHFSLARAYRALGRADEAAKEVRIYKTLKAEEASAALSQSERGKNPSHLEEKSGPDAQER
jgi:tetratricopeptide (TPR) repeat protein